jgi:hypothetical protein
MNLAGAGRRSRARQRHAAAGRRAARPCWACARRPCRCRPCPGRLPGAAQVHSLEYLGADTVLRCAAGDQT